MNVRLETLSFSLFHPEVRQEPTNLPPIPPSNMPATTTTTMMNGRRTTSSNNNMMTVSAPSTSSQQQGQQFDTVIATKGSSSTTTTMDLYAAPSSSSSDCLSGPPPVTTTGSRSSGGFGLQRVVSKEDEAEDMEYNDAEEFDFSHLVEEETDEEEDDYYGDGDFEPYYDHETNRIIMRMRMGRNFMADDGEEYQEYKEYSDGDGEEFDPYGQEQDGVVDQELFEEGGEYEYDTNEDQFNSVDRWRSSSLLEEEEEMEYHYDDGFHQQYMDRHYEQQQEEEMYLSRLRRENHDNDTSTQRAYLDYMMSNPIPPPPPPPPPQQPSQQPQPPPPPSQPQPHRSSSDRIMTLRSKYNAAKAATTAALHKEDDLDETTSTIGGTSAADLGFIQEDGHHHQPPLLCTSSASSSDTATNNCDGGVSSGDAADDNGYAQQQRQQQQPSSSPQPQQDEEGGQEREEQQVQDGNNHHNSRHNTVSSIENVLGLYTDMIYSTDQTNLNSIRDIMEKDDTKLSQREVAAFWIGFQCVVRQQSMMMNNKKKTNVVVSPVSSPTNATDDSTGTAALQETSVYKNTTSSNNIGRRGTSVVSSSHHQGSFLNDKKLLMSFITDGGSSSSSRRPTMTATTRKATTSSRNTTDNDDDVVGVFDEAKTSISVMSTMSCRELSIQRLKRRLTASRKRETSEVEELLKELQEAQERQKRLEQQLNNAGISIAEDIPYQEAKDQVKVIAQQMEEIGHSQITHDDPQMQAQLRQDYYILEQKMEKYIRALELTDEYVQEQIKIERTWDEENRTENLSSLIAVWKHMPVNIRKRSIEEWLDTPTPNGKFLPKPFLLKFSRTNVLMMLRMDPELIRKSHPSNLEQQRVSNLTLTERRALEAYLQPIATKHWHHGKDPLTKRKWNWYCLLRENLKDHVRRYQEHELMYATTSPSNRSGGGGAGGCDCPRNVKCPVKANKQLDYFMEDFGYPCDISHPLHEDSGVVDAPQVTDEGNITATVDTSKPQHNASANSTHSKHAEIIMKMKVKKRAAASNKTPRKSFLDELKARTQTKQ